jgi:ABC-type transport system substrate-binding protein
VISGDGRTYTFHLRKGVKFHHGRELEAEDVKFSLERLLRKDEGTSYFQFLASKVIGGQEYWDGKAGNVEGFKVRGKYIFEIQWKFPYLSALNLLSMDFCKILPRELVVSQGRGFFAKPVGTGPFKFDFWLRDPKLEIVGVRLVRNGDYFGRKPYLAALEFSPFFTAEHFAQKEVDIIPYDSERLSNLEVQVLESETFTTAFLMMSCDLPPLDNPAVRRAVSLAIDKKEIANAVFRMDTIPQVTNNFIPARLPGFYLAEGKETFDPEEAKRILGREGWGGENPFPLLSLLFPEPRQEEDSKIYRVLKDELEGLGIPLRMKYYRSQEEVQSIRAPYLAVVHWSLDFPDPENLVLPLFYSGSELNRAFLRYTNPDLDGLARAAEVEPSWTERIALFRRIEQFLNADRPAVPLYCRKHRLALQPYVRGVKTPPLGFFYLNARDIWLDK